MAQSAQVGTNSREPPWNTKTGDARPPYWTNMLSAVSSAWRPQGRKVARALIRAYRLAAADRDR